MKRSLLMGILRLTIKTAYLMHAEETWINVTPLPDFPKLLPESRRVRARLFP